MRPFSAILASAILATTLAGATVSISTPAMAYSCKSYPTQAVGVRKRKMQARNVARVGWKNIVKSNFGLPWSLWSIAKDRSNTCVYLQNIKKWRCLASAKPCLYVVP